MGVTSGVKVPPRSIGWPESRPGGGNQIFGKIQELVFDDVVIIPQYERGFIYVQDKQLDGVRRSRIGGDTNFNYSWIRREDPGV